MATVPFHWTNVRPIAGDQRIGFEELCCQLARLEAPSEGARFQRVGTPDGGVEAFWILPDGTEHGYQAKYFLSSGSIDHQQVKKSFERALSTHPHLTKYVVCMPLDLPDGTAKDKKSARQKWDEFKERLEADAKSKGREVDIVFWGSHELIGRLQKPQNRGLSKWWFDKDLLAPEWFRKHIESARANAGPRYSPEVHVETAISDAFEWICYTQDVRRLILGISNTLRKYQSVFATATAADFFQADLQKASKALDGLIHNLGRISEREPTKADIEDALAFCDALRFLCSAGWERQRRAESVGEGQSKREQLNSSPGTEEERRLYYSLDSLFSEIAQVEQVITSQPCEAMLTRVLVLTGEAGIGKTHSLCSFAERLIEEQAPVLLLYGEDFRDDEPWSQVISLIGSPVDSAEELLGALNSAGQVAGCRALIFIDALNEGVGRFLWRKYLAGITQTVRSYPNVALVVSVRSSYEPLTIPEGLFERGQATSIRHPGFSGYEADAFSTYFEHYGISLPSFPVLLPEFENPLFLSLVCKGLKNLGLREIPVGFHGINRIFEFFLNSVNERLSRPERMDFSPSRRIVFDAVDRMAAMMYESDSNWVDYDAAESALDELMPRNPYTEKLLYHLISEGVVWKDVKSAGSVYKEVVRFTYERISDYSVAHHVIDSLLGIDTWHSASHAGAASGTQRGLFWRLITRLRIRFELRGMFPHAQSLRARTGLLEALAVTLPEATGYELFEVLPRLAADSVVIHATLNSISWREPAHCSEKLQSFVERLGIASASVVDELIATACRPDHPFNADFLHAKLGSLTLAERDATWSIYLFKSYDSYEDHRNRVRVLIEWIRAADLTKIPDESRRLLCTVAAWFLTSSHRFLRDKATKALVALMTDHLGLMSEVLERFSTVNDPYLRERLYAVAYGVAMRSPGNKQLSDLAETVYELEFADGKPTPHILLRDYARGVIETARIQECELGFDLEGVRPPYISDIDTLSQLDEEIQSSHSEARTDSSGPKEWSHIVNDVIGTRSSDFARYIIDHALDGWTPHRLGREIPKSPKEVREGWFAGLTDGQRSLVDQILVASREATSLKRVREYVGEHENLDDRAIEELEHGIAAGLEDLRASLEDDQIRILETVVLPIELDGSLQYKYEQFDKDCAIAWMAKRIAQCGWTNDRFGKFDQSIAYAGRTAHKRERIGKKYLWMALHELLARLSDNFHFRGSFSSETWEEYQGPWQVGVRDIDPTCLISKAMSESPTFGKTNWWMPIAFNEWPGADGLDDWLQSGGDLPDPSRLLLTGCGEEDSEWVVLESYPEWEEPSPPGIRRFDAPVCNIWYSLRSYLVSAKESLQFVEWGKDRNFKALNAPRLPHNSHETGVFLGEYYNHPCYLYHFDKYFGKDGWTDQDGSLPTKVLATSETYLAESGTYDCSLEGSISILLPCKELVSGLRLSWRAEEGRFFTPDGALAALDPSIRETGPHALLIRRDLLQDFLERSGLALVWVVTGEKRQLAVHSGVPFKGRLDLSGMYLLQEGPPAGGFRAFFREPHND